MHVSNPGRQTGYDRLLVVETDLWDVRIFGHAESLDRYRNAGVSVGGKFTQEPNQRQVIV